MATDFDCFKWGGKHGGDACTYLADCEPGYVCGSSSCLAWCHPAGSNSSICGGTKCAQFSNLTPVYNSAIYGYCQ